MFTSQVIKTLCLLALAAGQRQDCEQDEVQLLQIRSDDKQMQIPGLDKLGDTLGNVVGAAHEIANQGIGQVTAKISDALDSIDKDIQEASLKLNKSVDSFRATANATGTVSQNLTKMQKLVTDMVEQMVPSYQATLDKIEAAVDTTKTVLSAMGQKDLLDKIDGCKSTATNQLSSLADKTQAIAQDMSAATEKELGESLKRMDSLLDQSVETVKSFRGSFNEHLATFTSSLAGPLAVALGDETPEKIGNLTMKADGVLSNLQSLVVNASTALQSCGTMVDSTLTQVSSGGFLGRIFKGIFG